eukprot:1281114-Rhodomonas_salina.1
MWAVAVPGVQVEPSARTSRQGMRADWDGGARLESRRPLQAVVQGWKGYKYSERSMYCAGTKRALMGFDRASVCNDGFNAQVCQENRAMGMECEDGSCSNKALQMRAFIRTEVRCCTNKGKGLGLFAAEQGQAGDAVEEMVGYVLSEAVVMTLVDALAPGEPNYICKLPGGLAIDVSKMGNWSCHLNHSCAPNAHLQPVLVGRELRIGVVLDPPSLHHPFSLSLPGPLPLSITVSLSLCPALLSPPLMCVAV